MTAAQAKTAEKLIASNPSRGDFFIEEVVEAGLVLQGTEVKSMRQTAPNLKDAYVDVRSSGSAKKLEAFLVNAHVAPYSHGTYANHEPNQRRKLLLHRHQIERLYGSLIREGMTIIPLRLYFKSGRVKVELGVGKGKKRHDKREDLKKKSADREMDRAMKSSRSKGSAGRAKK